VIKQALVGGISYLRSNPRFVLQAARNAARLEVSIPLDLLRWALERRPRGKGPERIELRGADPSLRVELTVDLFGTKIDVGSSIAIESIENQAESLKLALRLRDLAIKAPQGSPAAQFVQSLDLSKPGNLIQMMPPKHARLIEVQGDRLVIDLLKLPALARNRGLRRALAGLSFVAIRALRVENDLLIIGFALHPLAIPGALDRARRT
jgi:hypothetical protein